MRLLSGLSKNTFGKPTAVVADSAEVLGAPARSRPIVEAAGPAAAISFADTVTAISPKASTISGRSTPGVPPAARDLLVHTRDRILGQRFDDLGPVENACPRGGVTVAQDGGVLQDVGHSATALGLGHEVPGQPVSVASGRRGNCLRSSIIASLVPGFSWPGRASARGRPGPLPYSGWLPDP